MKPITTTRPIRYSDPLAVLAAMQHLCGPDNAFLLESLAGPDTDLRASVVGAGGLFELVITEGEVRANGQPAVVAAGLRALRERGMLEERAKSLFLADDSDLWRIPEVLRAVFAPDGIAAANIGVLAYYGYDAVRYAERLPRPEHLRGDEEPDAVFSLIHASVTMPFAASTGYAAAISTDLWDSIDIDALCTLTGRAADLDRPGRGVGAPAVSAPSAVRDDCTFDEYAARVRRALEHIRAGDVYQLQLGHEITITTSVEPMTVYERMRHSNASPYMCHLPLAGSVIVGASPELFVRVVRDEATMRPIAGTARRLRDPELDATAVRELRESDKERAEHIMLVDLCRNDLGRVAVTDTTVTHGLMTVEQYSHVFHLVTTVVARVMPGLSVSDVVRAAFPAGTMTGAPKVRAMQLIDELETSPRGFYAGAFGIIGFNDDAVLGLSIRMAVWRDGRYRIRASAGIVADSTPEGEWNETLSKMGAAYHAVTGEELR